MLRLERPHRITVTCVHRWASIHRRDPMLYIGIDWSEGEQVVCVCNAQGAALSQFGCAMTLAGFQRLEDERLKLHEPAADCLVAIETTYHLMVDYLLDRSYAVYWVPPQATAAYRNRQRSSGAHTDQR